MKYPERFPALAVLDPDGLKRVWYTENKKSKIPVIMIPMIITALWIRPASLMVRYTVLMLTCVPRGASAVCILRTP